MEYLQEAVFQLCCANQSWRLRKLENIIIIKYYKRSENGKLILLLRAFDLFLEVGQNCRIRTRRYKTSIEGRKCP